MTATTQTAAGVYLVTAPGGLHKIGESANPANRLSALDPSGFGLVLTHTIASGQRRWLEAYLHQAFAHRWVQREWFRLADEEIELIRAIPAAEVESDLPAAVIALHRQHAPPPPDPEKPEQPKRGRGRPRLDPAGVQVSQHVKLTPAEIDWLRTRYGSVNAGVRAVVTSAMKRKK